ncbi:hypothetical protein QO058_08910 [Bosea vestrisii]|uniref:hypothetical protein n=1 Tax=Bosea vestrisii TaxID=151416 RepID=UPI0024DFDEC5|nr:hypothetical protein [Bosea vestrisii]WID98337.1 hypothetical protein QO058_08910 [Bosea vestrisii]
MDSLAELAGMDRQMLTLAGLLAVVGALLGGALAHWFRGRGMIATGAIIGAILLPLTAIAYMVHFGVIVVAIVLLVILGGLANLLGG